MAFSRANINGAPSFSIEADIASYTTLNASLNVPPSKGLLERKVRRVGQKSNSCSHSDHASGLNASSLLNTSNAVNVSRRGEVSSAKRTNDSFGKTPTKHLKTSPARGGSFIRTPGRSPGRSPGRTPGRKTPKGGDRYIPNRSQMDFEAASFLLTKGELNDSGKDTLSPSKREHQNRMMETLVGRSRLGTSSILSYDSKSKEITGNNSSLHCTYSQSKSQTPVSKKFTRHIPSVPERILDAPDISNDFYLNLIDWSPNNLLAVALANRIFIWNAGTGEIKQLLELEDPDDVVCSVKWVKEGCILAVGTTTGDIGIWDAENLKRIRVLQGHSDRVGCLSWNQYILSSGSRSGRINHSDVRVSSHLVKSLAAHTQEVCGLAWSPDGRMLASGGNDNILNIWCAERGELFTSDAPLHSFNHHLAAVKAVAWCPWNPSVLASGGGTADKCIRIWNCNNGTLLNSVETNSQVCSLLWSSEYKELVSAHGFENNEIIIWKYPKMERIAELLGHTERVLNLSLSPDGSTMISAGADETLRLWKCFVPDPKKLKSQAKTKESTALSIGRLR